MTRLSIPLAYLFIFSKSESRAIFPCEIGLVTFSWSINSGSLKIAGQGSGRSLGSETLLSHRVSEPRLQTEHLYCNFKPSSPSPCKLQSSDLGSETQDHRFFFAVQTFPKWLVCQPESQDTRINSLLQYRFPVGRWASHLVSLPPFPVS